MLTLKQEIIIQREVEKYKKEVKKKYENRLITMLTVCLCIIAFCLTFTNVKLQERNKAYDFIKSHPQITTKDKEQFGY
jgi:hypothetical protein